jgi:leucyl aminopeptidase
LTGRGSAATAARIPQFLPEVVEAPGTLADTPLLAEDTVSVVVIGVAPAREADDGIEPRGGTVDAAARYGIDLAELAERAGGPGFTGAAGDCVTVDLPRAHGEAVLPWDGLPRRLVLLGLGEATPADLRRAGAALARSTRGMERVVSAATAGTDAAETAGFVEGYLLGAYRQPRLGATKTNDGPAEQLVLLGAPMWAIEDAIRSATATWLVRDLANTPSNTKNPQWFVDRATELAEATGLDISVRGVDELAAQGFGGILAVGGASVSPPRLVVVGYEPTEPAGRHVVVVGKGITYDTGGLSIKPREAMVPMKTDMAGAAVALAVVVGAAQANLAHRVTAVVPLAENHVGADSYRPGDVLALYGGRTVEVLNTDAEGRIVLADGLAFAADTLAPDLLVDVATLTGAASVGLGRGHGALLTRDDSFAEAVERAGVATGECVWRLPLVDDYASALSSPVADLRNIATDLAGQPVGGGAILAGLFLEHFAGEVPWIHLDIAGPARSASAAHENPLGATGFGARLLLQFLADL